MKDENIILEVNNLKMYFPIQKGVFRRVVGHVKAVDGVDFSIRKGETVGLVGESGCGKTTVSRCIVRLLEPTAGNIFFRTTEGIKNLAKLKKNEIQKVYHDLQIIYQDPYSSLDPRMSVRDIIAEPLKVNNIGNRKERTEKVRELLNKVGLSDYHVNRYPHQFSGGQRQRIGIARALSLNPDLILCDEPVSALDVSVQAQVLNLLSDLQTELNLTYLFIAHDLSVVEHISDRVMVMYLGKIVEIAESDEIYNKPGHPYTEALLQSIPVADPKSGKSRHALQGSVPDPSEPPSGCNFHPRCKYVKDICCKEEPQLVAAKGNNEHMVSCHFAQDLNLEGFITRKKHNSM